MVNYRISHFVNIHSNFILLIMTTNLSSVAGTYDGLEKVDIQVTDDFREAIFITNSNFWFMHIILELD